MKTLKIFIISLINLLFLQQTTGIACGWVENPEVMRISMFRAVTSDMSGYYPFFYNASYLASYDPDPMHNDWFLNCKLWQNETGSQISKNDIYSVLYKIDADRFLLAVQDNALNQQFGENTFIQFLLKPQNKDVLDYVIFAKQNEFYFASESNPWFDVDTNTVVNKPQLASELLNNAETKIKSLNNNFLKMRYAYHLVRMYRSLGLNAECVKAFDLYFKDADYKNVLYVWTLLHKALALDDLGRDTEANYLCALIFNYSDEKKLRAYNWFSKEQQKLTETLKMAKNNTETACILSLAAFKNPGRALQQIQQIWETDKTNPSITTLIMREINKLEDWILTPQFTGYNSMDLFWVWDEAQEKIARENHKSDLLYLKTYRDFLISILPAVNGETADFISVGIAHLFFLTDDYKQGESYIARIKNQNNPTIVLQIAIDRVLITLSTEDILNDKVKEKLAQQLLLIANKTSAAENGKLYYSLLRKLSFKYREKKQNAIAGLLYNKSEQIKNNHPQTWEGPFDESRYYWYIAWFDRYATVKDMTDLITMTEKTQKSGFEKFLLEQKLADINTFKDLKGTIAFRTGDLQTALKTFESMPQDYWENNYEYSNYLNENPFLPKSYSQEPDYGYKFNKTQFVKQLLDLEKEAKENTTKLAENYLKLGNAFYNCSYWGNSWMMCSYYWSSNFSFDTWWPAFDNLFGKISETEKQYAANYYDCRIAFDYFKKAIENTTDTELKAHATFMLHCCELARFSNTEMRKPWDMPRNSFKSVYAAVFCKDFMNTDAYKKIGCMMLEDYR